MQSSVAENVKIEQKLFLMRLPNEQAKKVYDQMMERDYCSQWLGTELLELDEGFCVLKMKVRKEMLNGFGTLHGGIAFSLADSALAFASNSYGRISPLINGSMNYSKAAHEGDCLIAEAKVFSISNKKADIDVTIFKEGEKEAYYFMRGTVYRTSKTFEQE